MANNLQKVQTMKINKYFDDNIIIIEDFLSPEELSFMDNFLRNFPYDEMTANTFAFWHKRLLNEHVMTEQPPHLRHALDPIVPYSHRILDRIRDVLNAEDRQADWKLVPHNFIKMYPESAPEGFRDDNYDEAGKGLEMFIHVDDQEHMSSPIYWGAVLYINEDYEGGEIYYPDYEWLYKPKAGSMALHRGTVKHGVKKVTSGNRYCAPTLVSIKNDYRKPVPAWTGDPKEPFYYPPGYWGKRLPDDPIQGDIRVPREDGTVAEYDPNPVLNWR